MSDYQRRFDAAEIELDEAGIWPSNAVPPYVWFLRKLGYSPIPPHYKPFWQSLVGHTVWFTILLGLTSLSTVGPDDRSVPEFMARTGLIGVALGLCMVLYFAHSRWKYALSRWEDL